MQMLVLDSYGGDSDPKDHLLYFNTKMVISVASDVVKCRMFPSTFKSTAMAWFTTLPRGSISNFCDFSSKFLGQFSANKIQQGTINERYNIRQREGESLKKYMACYSAASVKVEDEEPRTCALAFKNGLLPGSLNNKLSRKPARSMAEMLSRASTYILDEEDDAFKRKRARMEKDRAPTKHSGKDKYSSERGEGSWCKEEKGKLAAKPTREQLYPLREDYERRRPWQSQRYPHRRDEADMVLNTNLTDMFREAKAASLVDEPEAPRYQPRGADPNKGCKYHPSIGHDTDSCWTLRQGISSDTVGEMIANAMTINMMITGTMIAGAVSEDMMIRRKNRKRKRRRSMRPLLDLSTQTLRSR
ncbi:uncharacterized protein LOC130736611 [Lotus japonicus]|uniref:uncharacterized protein LOC130736611 n=1 Tax=Lotus japonicus TaxID=34305 RepID=UPI00258A1015|nr:uncharacterized protein LOC130736611 [Lotus japonicus]